MCVGGRGEGGGESGRGGVWEGVRCVGGEGGCEWQESEV